MSRPSSSAGVGDIRSSTPRSKAGAMGGTRNARPGNSNMLASLRQTQIIASKPVLPAELIAVILDYVPVPDLLRCARVSRRLREMVYDDSRWIQKLRVIGVWNEAEARRRVDDALRRKMEAQRVKDEAEAKRSGGDLSVANGTSARTRAHARSVTIFDAGQEERRYRSSLDQSQQPVRRHTLTDGFEDLTISPLSPDGAADGKPDTAAALHILERVQSIRGKARQEFAKVYAALGLLYLDLSTWNNQSNSAIFRLYRDPEQQAQVLSQLRRFSRCDHTEGWAVRQGKLDALVQVFEGAVLREFEQGLASDDVDGRMKRYAHVLVSLNGGRAAIDTYIDGNAVIQKSTILGNALDCLDGVAQGHVDLNSSQAFFERLARLLVDQATTIDRIFPPGVDVFTPFLSRVCEGVLADYLTTLYDEAHGHGRETYVKAVSGTFGQAVRLAASLKPSRSSPSDFAMQSSLAITQCFDRHVDLYLTEELAFFESRAAEDVTRWERDLSEQQETTESYFMSNINRQAAKRDFLTSFKKVVMMPVNVLPAFPFAASKAAPNPALASLEASAASHSRPRTPTLTDGSTPNQSSTPVHEAPTTELAAKAAIMKSRLEGIKTLFSIEVALGLTHLAQSCIERAALFVKMPGKHGLDAKEQCETVFVKLLEVLGTRHIRTGFDKAVEHLGNYNPRQVREYRAQTHSGDAAIEKPVGVEPLVTFLELVNVGDLIQQMIDVFYAQELVATKLTDRDDFLDPAVKEKKRFEQMLDERVAAGLNKGIDVLIDEVEYIFATTQQALDFNPGADAKPGSKAAAVQDLDISPTATAKQIVDMISGHTSMLVGSTDKNMLDVFMQEVGLRLFTALCKHFKRQRISVDGSIKLISDINHYSTFITSLRQKPLLPYFAALRELGQIYLIHIDPPGTYFGGGGGKRISMLSTKATKTSLQSKELAAVIADHERYHGIFPTEEVYEFAERRADWYVVKGDVERA
ncbi:F-box protein: endocytic membrane traffic, recycling ReCYcling 1, partial [Oleoguttula sp. CCFEE 5521]